MFLLLLAVCHYASARLVRIAEQSAFAVDFLVPGYSAGTKSDRLINPFRCGKRGSDAVEDRGALILIIGWRGEWSTLIHRLDLGSVREEFK